MNKKTDYQQDLASIRQLMEHSVKFISLSGLSGIMAGSYALAGAGIAYFMIYDGNTVPSIAPYQQHPDLVLRLGAMAALVLLLSLATGWYLSLRKAKKLGSSVWNTTSKKLLLNLTIPLAVGGIFILIVISNGYYDIISSSFLLFYGLALLNASANLYNEMRYLGYTEIILGLIAALFPGFGLFFWAVGFGVLHIIYGAMMYRKYDRV